MDFGFTNNVGIFDAVRAWRDAAIADGWQVQPTYPAPDPVPGPEFGPNAYRGEAMERACTLRRAGYTVHVITRTNVGKWKFEAKLSAWCPDGMAIGLPREYDLAAIVSAVRRCNYCKRENVDTERVGFAGRYCATCLPTVRKRVEYPGWDR